MSHTIDAFPDRTACLAQAWLQAQDLIARTQESHPGEHTQASWATRNLHFVRIWRQDPERAAREEPVLARAHDLCRPCNCVLRQELKARFLTLAPFAGIGHVCGLSPEVVEAFYCVFFPVRRATILMGHTVTQVIRLETATPAAFLKLGGYLWGPAVIDTWALQPVDLVTSSRPPLPGRDRLLDYLHNCLLVRVGMLEAVFDTGDNHGQEMSSLARCRELLQDDAQFPQGALPERALRLHAAALVLDRVERVALRVGVPLGLPTVLRTEAGGGALKDSREQLAVVGA